MTQVWFITGSSRGLGRAIVESVLSNGNRVVATARKPEQLDDLKARYGDQLLTVALDVRNPEQVGAAVQSAIDTFGQIDVLVNNAGYGNLVAFEQSSEAEFRDQLETNFWGAINVTRAVLPSMRQQRSGHIVQISSIGGRIGMPGFSAYQAAKWGLEGFSEVLAQEVAPFGLKVIIIEPGAMPTDWGGSSMHVTPPSADYQPSVGTIMSMFATMTDGNTWGSDPNKVAQAINTIIAEPEPPLRLLIGSDALQLALATDERKLAETRKWQELSVSTDRAR